MCRLYMVSFDSAFPCVITTECKNTYKKILKIRQESPDFQSNHP
jgi:hypothetical protein